MTGAYAALLAWSFLAATIVPLGSEAPLVYLVHTHKAWLAPVAVATVGNYLGACTTYWLARGVAGAVRRHRPHSEPSPHQRRAHTLVRRWGAAGLLLSWVPILGDALVAAAGALRLPFARASLALVLGKLARYLVVAWAALSL